MTKYGVSPWVGEYPKSRLPSYPRYRGASQTGVVIIGGGLTGCATAYAFAAAGVAVTLLEAGRLGRGCSGSSAGWIDDDPGVSFADVQRDLGLRATRQAWRTWRRAALDFTALVRRLNLKCRLEPHGSLLVASTPEQAAQLKREQKIRRDAGLDTSLVGARVIAAEAGIRADAAIRSRGGALIDPYRAALGLASAAADRGATIFEGSPVRKVTFGARSVDVHTAGGQVRAERVIVATGVPTALFKSLIRHFWFKTSYLALTDRIPAQVRHQLGTRQMVVRDRALPPHLVRWVDDERLLVAGADADGGGDKLREKVIVQRTGQLMYELSTMYPEISGIQPQFGWDAPYAKTADGLPFIGPHRNYPHHLFAWGGAGHSVTGAYLASRVLLRHHQGEVESSDDVFGFRLEKRS